MAKKTASALKLGQARGASIEPLPNKPLPKNATDALAVFVCMYVTRIM